jgi:hypothetical protein
MREDLAIVIITGIIAIIATTILFLIGIRG